MAKVKLTCTYCGTAGIVNISVAYLPCSVCGQRKFKATPLKIDTTDIFGYEDSVEGLEDDYYGSGGD